MNLIQVETADGVTSFFPGETVEIRVWWQLEPPPDRIEARLFWFTRGKGTQDVGVVETVPLENPGRQGQRSLSFRLPEGPFSFSGKLISLVWAVEVVALPGEVAGRIELTISPTGAEIRLQPA